MARYQSTSTRSRLAIVSCCADEVAITRRRAVIAPLRALSVMHSSPRQRPTVQTTRTVPVLSRVMPIAGYRPAG